MLYTPPPRGGLFTIGDTSAIANNYGTAVTPGSSTKGSWAEAIASTPAHISWLEVHINSATTNAASRNVLVDIGIGAAGSEVVLIPDLIGGNAWFYTADGIIYRFPVSIPAGTRIAARASGSVTTGIRVLINILTARSFDLGFQKFAAIGIANATQGTFITPGTVSFSSWVSLGTVGFDASWWQIGYQVSSGDTSHQAVAIAVELAFGDGTTLIPLLTFNPVFTSSTETESMIVSGLEGYRLVPSGSTIYARAQTSGTADNANVAAYAGG